jgi:hypothetical protein
MKIATSTTIDWTTDWSPAAAATVKRQDNELLMLCLLRLDSLPNLETIHHEWVDVVKLICLMLEKRPMVGFLVARRLKLPVDKTHALLKMLQIKGHITPVATDALKNNTEYQAYLSDSQANAVPQPDSPPLLLNHSASKTRADTNPEINSYHAPEPRSTNIFEQVWSVLNTDITFKRPTQSVEKGVLGQSIKKASHEEDTANKEKLNLIWRILETEITLKKSPKTYVMKSSSFDDMKALANETPVEPVSRFDQVWEFLNSEISVAVPNEQDHYKSNQP